MRFKTPAKKASKAASGAATDVEGSDDDVPAKGKAKAVRKSALKKRKRQEESEEEDRAGESEWDGDVDAGAETERELDSDVETPLAKTAAGQRSGGPLSRSELPARPDPFGFPRHDPLLTLSRISTVTPRTCPRTPR